MPEDLPTWLKPGAIAVSGTVIFAVTKVRKSKPPQPPSVHLAAGDESCYPLEDCRLATLTDLVNLMRFNAPCYIDEHGTRCLLSIKGNIVTLTRGGESRGVQMRPEDMAFAQSVTSFAEAFEGDFLNDWEVLNDDA